MQLDSKDFTFRDIVFLDDRIMLKLLQQVDSVTLAKSLYGSHEIIQEKIFHCMSSLDCAMLKEDEYIKEFKLNLDEFYSNRTPEKLFKEWPIDIICNGKKVKRNQFILNVQSTF